MEDLQEGSYTIIPILDALKDKTIIKIGSYAYRKVKDGMPIHINNHTEELVYLKYNERLVAIYELVDPITYSYKARRVWKQ